MGLRKIIFWIHLCVGVSVGIVIFIMAITGSMLAYRPQILELAEKNVRYVSDPGTDASPLSLDQLVAAVKTEHPDAKVRSILIKPAVNAAVAISLGDAGLFYVNPYTGKILGKESNIHDFLEKVEVWHRWLGMEGKLKPIGHNIKGVCNILFFIMIITGVYLWWPKNWSWPGIKNIVVFNSLAQGRARDWNWHNVIGFWMAPALTIITVTGVIMSYTWATNLLYTMTGNQPPKQEQRAGMDKADKPKKEETAKALMADLNQFYAQTIRQVKEWKSMTIRMPQKDGGPVTVMIQEKSAFGPLKRSQLTFDGSTAEIKKSELFGDQNMGRQLRLWARYTHTGETGGVVGQTIAFIASLGAVVLVWTGMAMAWNRFYLWRQRR